MLNVNDWRFRLLVWQARAARNAGRLESAAVLYSEALEIRPDQAAVRVQCGHMYKEQGKLAQAEQQYLLAEELIPGDPDLSLQFGHFYKVSGRLGEAEAAYKRALAQHPNWGEPKRELASLAEDMARVRSLPDAPASVTIGLAEDCAPPRLRRSAAELARLVPALDPRPADDVLFCHAEEIVIRQIGRRETTFWGNRQVLRGVEAIRGFCVAKQPIVEVQVIVAGIRIASAPLKGGYVLHAERDPLSIRKYVFNIWLDFGGYTPGRYQLELHFFDGDGRRDVLTEDVVVAEPIAEEAYPDSNFLVSIVADDPRSIEEQIRSRPSMVRSARRSVFPHGISSVLVLRLDQLGDLVASVPALFRLRQLLPEAHLTGVFSSANGDMARTLGLFDRLLVVDFPDDPLERRRLLALDAQEALRAALSTRSFDVAVDLGQGSESREVLRLADARLTYGWAGGDWPWMSADFRFHVRDRWTPHDAAPHSTKVSALIEGLATLLPSSPLVLRREDLSPERLGRFGISPGQRFVVLHAGARIRLKWWPHFGELAGMLLDRTDVALVIVTDDASLRETFGRDIIDDPRVFYVEDRLPFDDFDALMSFATVIVANDSGPKHLAALRGTNVVTILSARVNWTEWGQEGLGTVISRKLPCAGCSLVHDPEECGRDFVCITDIRTEEVFEAVDAFLQPRQAIA